MLGKIAKVMAIIGALMFFGALFVPMILDAIKWAPTFKGFGDVWARYLNEWREHPYFQTWWHGFFLLVLSMLLGLLHVAIKQKKKLEKEEQKEDGE